MVSKRMMYLLGALLQVSVISQMAHADVWKALCSSVEYTKKHPLMIAASVFSVAALSTGIYWWYKSAHTKKVEPIVPIVPKTSVIPKKIDPIPTHVPLKEHENPGSEAHLKTDKHKKMLDNSVAKWQRAIATFENSKNLIKRNSDSNLDSQIFYAQMRDFLHQIRSYLTPDQTPSFDVLELDFAIEGSKEYWDGLAKLFFLLDELIVDAYESLFAIQKAQLRLGFVSKS